MSRTLEIRSSENLSRTLEHRVSLYSLAAAAAGVSMLALAQPSEGEVVVTKTNIAVGQYNSPAYVDLNHDGLNDFEFTVAANGTCNHCFYATLAVAALTGGKPVGGARGIVGPYGSALASGANIGPSAHFSSSVARGQVTLERSVGGGSISTNSFYTLYGQWPPGTTKYLGVKFLIKGQTHYGWIKLEMSTQLSGSITAGTITEYAYETIANKAISAGATASTAQATSQAGTTDLASNGPSLGMLAAGVDGLPLWRH
jgi:hypothetical protein